MNTSIELEKPVVRLRAFRAIDEPETCRSFVEGHAEVLTSIGITKVTSSKNAWTDDPCVFVIVVESLDKKKIFGGARVHVSGGTQPLPIEEATAPFDASVYDLIWNYAQNGTGEVCGLWNSKELAGYGIGSPLLIRTGIAICNQIGLQTLFALCAPYTVKPVVNCGMVLEDRIGNNGTFYYPKLDLLATAMLLKDVDTLSNAADEDKTSIFEMRTNPAFKIEVLKQKNITIYFELEIPKLDQWDLSKAISNAKKKHEKTSVRKEEIDFF